MRAGSSVIAGSPTPASGRQLPLVSIGSARLHAITETECIDVILLEIEAGRGGWVLTTNVDHLWWAAHDPSYAQLCANATLNVADGMPLLWASRLRGTPLPERVAGSNLIWSLSVAAALQSRSIFLLGGDPGTAEQGAAALLQRSSDVRVAGTCCPPLGFFECPDEVKKISASIREASPDIVFIALAKPVQTQLMERLHAEFPRAWFVGVGISFSFLSGRVRRAPHWMQRAGLEWLHRLVQEPGRLWRRYLIHGLPVAAFLLVQAAMDRLHQRP
jgi:N-acetylglucosaminyldiphosphoundecaprenol N-acetyl-beta-D-mannosaminyltransferase